ncbi:MAG: HD domain-containing protein [Nitrospirae bacterium]|nr:HD domain-containing protein [Nitrospirota bacterium]
MDYDKKLKQLETFINVSSLINSTLDTREIRERTITALTTLLNAEAGSLLLIDDETGELFFEVATGEKGMKLKRFRLKTGEGIAGWVVQNGEPVIVNDAVSDPRFSQKADLHSGFITKSIICMPVKSKEKIIGVLQGINKNKGIFTADDLELIKSIADQVAIAIENARLYIELRETFFATTQALAEMIELRDPYTGGHTKRVMNYSTIIGRYMELDKTQFEKLRLAAILHDIGKIGVRDAILLKQGGLNDEEFDKMKMHAHYGAEILGRIKQLKDVIPGVKDHHERFDGKGYPDGLKNEAISLIARIIAVADTFDAMTTDRPYRKGLSVEKAFEEFRKGSDTQFDKAVVDAFLNAWEDGELTLEK